MAAPSNSSAQSQPDMKLFWACFIALVATSFVFGGNTGLLTLDKRNGNVWFIPRGQDMEKTWFKEPVFLIRVPFEKLDQPPPAQ